MAITLLVQHETNTYITSPGYYVIRQETAHYGEQTVILSVSQMQRIVDDFNHCVKETEITTNGFFVTEDNDDGQ